MPWIIPPNKSYMIKLVDDYQRITTEPKTFHLDSRNPAKRA